MFSKKVFAGAALLLGALGGIATAQDPSYPYSVSPGSFSDPSMLSFICTSQNNVCRTLCYKGLEAGSPYCDPPDIPLVLIEMMLIPAKSAQTTLQFTCKCANGPTPDLTKFNGTVYFYECEQFVAQCQVENTDNPQKQQKCLNIPCGGKNATTYVDALQSTSSSTPSPTSKPGNSGSGNGGNGGSGSGSNSGSGSGSGGNSGGNGGASGLNLANSYGLALFIGTAMILFGVGLGL